MADNVFALRLHIILHFMGFASPGLTEQMIYARRIPYVTVWSFHGTKTTYYRSIFRLLVNLKSSFLTPSPSAVFIAMLNLH